MRHGVSTVCRSSRRGERILPAAHQRRNITGPVHHPRQAWPTTPTGELVADSLDRLPGHTRQPTGSGVHRISRIDPEDGLHHGHGESLAFLLLPFSAEDQIYSGRSHKKRGQSHRQRQTDGFRHLLHDTTPENQHLAIRLTPARTADQRRCRNGQRSAGSAENESTRDPNAPGQPQGLRGPLWPGMHHAHCGTEDHQKGGDECKYDEEPRGTQPPVTRPIRHF